VFDQPQLTKMIGLATQGAQSLIVQQKEILKTLKLL